MISREDLLEYKAYFIDERQVEKDYLQNLVLYEMYTSFSFDLVFKGGTALKVFYNLDRFSEDLDFTYAEDSERKKTMERFERVLHRVDGRYKIGRLKRRGTKTSLDYGLDIEGPMFARTRSLQNLELNISMREKLVLEPTLETKEPIYKDIPLFSAYVMAPAEILAEKIRAVLTRKHVKARDVYDIYYLMKFKHIRLRPDIVNSKLDLYSKKFSRIEVEERIDSIGSASWKSELSNVIRLVPEYDEIVKYIGKNL